MFFLDTSSDNMSKPIIIFLFYFADILTFFWCAY